MEESHGRLVDVGLANKVICNSYGYGAFSCLHYFKNQYNFNEII